MDFSTLFTSTSGRIGRQSWWIGTIILIIVNVVITMLILPMIGFSMIPNLAGIDVNDAAAVSSAVMGSVSKATWASLIIFIIMAFPLYALGVKRRHDKNNNGLDYLIWLALYGITLLVTALGMGYTATDLGNGVVMPTPSVILMILNGVTLILGIYILVVCGFLKGTTGPNQYGPDPVP